VELRAGVRLVVTQAEIAVVPGVDPGGQSPVAVAATVEVDEPEGPGSAGFPERQRRRDVEARAARSREERVQLVHDDRRDAVDLVRHAGAGGGRRGHGCLAYLEDVREERGSVVRHLDDDGVVRLVVAAEGDAPARQEPPAVRGRVLVSENLSLRRIDGKRLSTGQRGGVGRRLRLPLLAIPRADVGDQRRRSDEDGEEEHGHENGLTALAAEPVAHSSRSVIVLCKFPNATAHPRTLIEYG